MPNIKKGIKHDIKNYRSISSISNFAKVFETLLYKEIFNLTKHLITPYQHGFVPKRSIVTNLAVYSQFVSEAINANEQVDVISTDFQKTFDQIDHQIFLGKLDRLGFTQPMLHLFRSYLLNRQFFVRYRNFISTSFTPTSGILQGSNLCPLLFLLFINDLPDIVTSHKLLFADDFKLYRKICSMEDCLILQHDIEFLILWCRLNRLTLNISKCVVVTMSRKQMLFHYDYIIDGTIIKRSTVYNDLGILFDDKFTFIEHINEVVAKAYKTYGFIYRNCKDFNNPHVLKILFFSLVRSILEYGSLIWYPIYATHCNHIEFVQRKFLKFLTFLEDGTYPPQGYGHSILLGRFGVVSLNKRRDMLCIKFLINCKQ